MNKYKIKIFIIFFLSIFMFSYCKKTDDDVIFVPFTVEKFKQVDSIPIAASDSQSFICQGYGRPINNKGFLYTGSDLFMGCLDRNIGALKKEFLPEKSFQQYFWNYLEENTETVTENVILTSEINYWNNCLYFGSSFNGNSIMKLNLETGKIEKLIILDAPVKSLNMVNGDIYYTFGNDYYNIYEIWLLKNGEKEPELYFKSDEKYISDIKAIKDHVFFKLWTNSEANTLYSANKNKDSVPILSYPNESEFLPYYIVGDNIYYVDNFNSSLVKMDFNGGNREVIMTGNPREFYVFEKGIITVERDEAENVESSLSLLFYTLKGEFVKKISPSEKMNSCKCNFFPYDDFIIISFARMTSITETELYIYQY